jgi:hypothetical protein
MFAASRSLNPTVVRAQVERLRLLHPECWDDDDKLLLDMLEAETGLHEFLSAVAHRMQEASAHVAGLDALIEQNSKRRDRFDMRIQSLRNLASMMMLEAGVTRVEVAPITFSISNRPPKVIITDEAALPEDCIRIKREPDKALIRDRLRNGTPVPGATLSNQEPSLSVRTK